MLLSPGVEMSGWMIASMWLIPVCALALIIGLKYAEDTRIHSAGAGGEFKIQEKGRD